MEAHSGTLPVREGSSRTANRLQKKSSSGKQRSTPELDKISRFIAEHRPQTPALVVDLDIIADNYLALRSTLPIAEVYYAVKANPAPEVISRLVSLGSFFDVASPAEVELVMGAGAKPQQISFGNTIKKEVDIAMAHKRGVRMFAFDSRRNCSARPFARGAKVFCRLLMNCEGADWSSPAN